MFDKTSNEMGQYKHHSNQVLFKLPILLYRTMSQVSFVTTTTKIVTETINKSRMKVLTGTGWYQ